MRMDVIAESSPIGYELDLSNLLQLQHLGLTFDIDAEVPDIVNWLCINLPKLPKSAQLDSLKIGICEVEIEEFLTDNQLIKW
jgi:hypothetical protein